MCLGIPMQIVEITEDWGLAEAKGVRLRVNLQLAEGVGAGDWVIVHAGFAIQKIDAGQARETLALLSSMDAACPRCNGPLQQRPTAGALGGDEFDRR